MAMGTQWFDTLRGLKHASERAAGDPPTVRPLIRMAEDTSWRSWLATGARRVPIDRRRARGAEAHLKKILVGGPSGAVDFSSAMARQAIDEAMHDLPPQHRQVVKLAYFGGLTNREIANHLGLSVSGVRRVLRESLAVVGAHFERGRAKGRRAIQDLLLLPVWRLIGCGPRPGVPALDHVLQTGVVAVMTAAAAALLVTHQAPVHVQHPHKPPHVATIGSTGFNPLDTHKAVLAGVVNLWPPTAPNASANAPSAARPPLPLNVKAIVLKLPLSIPTPLSLTKLLPPAIGQVPLGA